MKLFYIITLLSLIFCINKDEQQVKEVHLSYNILNKKFKIRKYLDKKGLIHFYIENEHFRTNQPPTPLITGDFTNKNLVDIDYLINMSTKKKKELVKKGERLGVIRLLSNSEIFETIYLYEKKGKKNYRYKVKWIDEIIE